MSTSTKSARRAAIALVTTGLQSGSIKLLGPANAIHASGNGKADATYLITVIEDIAAKLTDADGD